MPIWKRYFFSKAPSIYARADSGVYCFRLFIPATWRWGGSGEGGGRLNALQVMQRIWRFVKWVKMKVIWLQIASLLVSLRFLLLNLFPQGFHHGYDNSLRLAFMDTTARVLQYPLFLELFRIQIWACWRIYVDYRAHTKYDRTISHKRHVFFQWKMLRFHSEMFVFVPLVLGWPVLRKSTPRGFSCKCPLPSSWLPPRLGRSCASCVVLAVGRQVLAESCPERGMEDVMPQDRCWNRSKELTLQ